MELDDPRNHRARVGRLATVAIVRHCADEPSTVMEHLGEALRYKRHQEMLTVLRRPRPPVDGISFGEGFVKVVAQKSTGGFGKSRNSSKILGKILLHARTHKGLPRDLRLKG